MKSKISAREKKGCRLNLEGRSVGEIEEKWIDAKQSKQYQANIKVQMCYSITVQAPTTEKKKGKQKAQATGALSKKLSTRDDRLVWW